MKKKRCSIITSWLMIFLLLVPIGTLAVVPVDVRTKFENNGCRIIKVKEVASTDLDFEVVYVAWCSAFTAYLSVMICKSGFCRISP